MSRVSLEVRRLKSYSLEMKQAPPGPSQMAYITNRGERMTLQVVVLPDVTGKEELLLKPNLTYQVPSSVWVVDAQTMEMLVVTEVTIAMAPRILLIPKVAGG